jgi:hypothetical protein
MQLDVYSENQPKESENVLERTMFGRPSRPLQDYPILGVRIGFRGERLVYRANRPGNQVSNQTI